MPEKTPYDNPAVIEHCDCCEEPIDGQPISGEDDEATICPRCAFELAVSQLGITQGQLAGAVSALDRLSRAVEAWDQTLSSYCDGPERDEVRAAALAASRLGGQ